MLSGREVGCQFILEGMGEVFQKKRGVRGLEGERCCQGGGGG